jgi:hypothetical protein
VAKKRNATKTRNNGEEEATLGSAEEEEEKGERRGREGCGAVEAWSDEVVEWVGDASEGCVCLACDFEIEYDRSAFLFKGEFRESGCACVRKGRRIEIMCKCSRMFIHFDVGMGVESFEMGRGR